MLLNTLSDSPSKETQINYICVSRIACSFVQQTPVSEKSSVEAEVSSVPVAVPIAAPVASVAPSNPAPAKKEEEDITDFGEKVCDYDYTQFE